MTLFWRLENLLWWFGLAALLWFLVTFAVQPVIAVFASALFGDGHFAAFDTARQLAASGRVRAAIWNTLWMTVASTVTVTIIGVFQVAVLEYFHVRGRALLKIGFATPLVFGSVIAAAGYSFTYGPGGSVTSILILLFPGLDPKWFSGGFAVLVFHTLLLTMFHFLFLRAAMRRVDYSTIEAARSLGASELTILLRVVLPVILPTLLAVTLLTVYQSVGSFAGPTILGGRDFHMLSQMILTLQSLRRADMAALLTLLLGVVLTALILMSAYAEKRGTYVGGSKIPTPIQLKRVTNPFWNAVLHVAAYGLFILYIVPPFMVVLFSFAPASSIGIDAFPSTLTMKNYIAVLTDTSAFGPFWNSMRMGLIAVAIGLAVTLFASPIMTRGRGWGPQLLDLVFAVAWAVPPIFIAIGLINAFDLPNPTVGGAVLLGSFIILPLGYAVWVMPLMARFLRAAFAGLDPNHDDAARSLGASGFYRFRRVTFPMVAPTAILVSAITFNDIMSEYALSALLYNVNNRPLAIAIVDGERSPDPEQAAITLVYITLIMVISFVVVLSAERIGLGKGPETNRL